MSAQMVVDDNCESRNERTLASNKNDTMTLLLDDGGSVVVFYDQEQSRAAPVEWPTR